MLLLDLPAMAAALMFVCQRMIFIRFDAARHATLLLIAATYMPRAMFRYALLRPLLQVFRSDAAVDGDMLMAEFAEYQYD